MSSALPTYLKSRSQKRLVIRVREGHSGITRWGALVVSLLPILLGILLIFTFSVALGATLASVGCGLMLLTAWHVTDFGHEIAAEPVPHVLLQRRSLVQRQQREIPATGLAEVLLAVDAVVWIRTREGVWLRIFAGAWQQCLIVAEESARILDLPWHVGAFAGNSGEVRDYWIFTPQRLELRRAGDEVHSDKVTTIADLPLVIVDEGTPAPGYPPPRRYAYDLVCRLVDGTKYKLAQTSSLERQEIPTSRALLEAQTQRQRIADAMRIRLVGQTRD